MFGEVEEDVEILHRRPGRTLDEIVEAADEQHAAADDAGGDVAIVRVDGVLGRPRGTPRHEYRHQGRQNSD